MIKVDEKSCVTLPSSYVTPAGTSNELDVQHEWKENTNCIVLSSIKCVPQLNEIKYLCVFRMVFFLPCDHGLDFLHQLVVVVVVFTLKAVPVSTQYFLTSVLVQLTRTPSVVTG